MKIFVASTGKCGTVFMAHMFRNLTDFPSGHEPKPKCMGEVMEDVNNNKVLRSSTKRVLQKKVEQIRGDAKDGNYFESSNFFMKSFVYTVLGNFDDVCCIHLHRDLYGLLTSFAGQFKHYRYRNRRQWWLQSHWKRNILRTKEGLDYFETIVWNYLEIRARFYALKKKFVKTYDFDFNDINNLNAYYKMFNYFGIEAEQVDEIPNFERNATRNITFRGAARIIKNVKRSVK